MSRWRTEVLILLLLAAVVASALAFNMGSALAQDDGGVNVSPTQLTFNAVANGPAPPHQNVNVTASSTRSFAASASVQSGSTNWLTISPSGSLTTNRTISVSANPAGLAAGTYLGTITIRAGETTHRVPVTFVVSSGGGVNFQVSPTRLTFNATAGGAAPAAQSVNVTANTATAFTASASVQSGSTNWLTISPSGSSTTNRTIQASANPAGLAAGTYQGTITIVGGGVTDRVAVTFVINNAVVNLQVTPTQLTFNATAGGPAPANQTVSVTANVATAFTASASVQSGATNWLTISPSGSSTTNQMISVRANPAGLVAGTYSGTITITGGGVTDHVTVSFMLSSPNANLQVSPTQLTFNSANGATPASQTISVTATTPTAFTASASPSWLTISPSGNLTTNQTITVTVNPTGLAVGTSFSGAITITGGGVTDSVPVTLAISGAASGFRLIGWNDLGMHCDDGKDYSVFGLLPPLNTIHAQLIDMSGGLIVNPAGFTITYQGTHDPLTNTINTYSSPKTNWWTYASQLVTPLGFPAPALDTGLAPAGTPGSVMPGIANTPRSMPFSTTDNTWVAFGLPVVPYGDAPAPPFPHNDYPMMQLTATNSSGTVLATTSIVVPVSDDIGCVTCHGSTSGDTAAMPSSGWSNLTDPDKDMKHNILKKHDDRFATSSLFQTAARAVGYSTAGLEATTATGPVLCINCHAEVFLGLPGQPNIQPFSRAIHGLHASQIDPATNQPLDAATTRAACYRCHPGSTSQCLRGVMGNLTNAAGAHLIECQSCHGNLSNLAAPTRKAWFDEPTCQSCHTGTAVTNSGQIVYNSVFTSGTTMRVAADQTFASNPNTPATGESLFRFSSGHGGLQCESCHGSTHAEYPTNNVNDNVQSTTLQGHAGVLAECATCHSTVPSTVTGGPHGMHPIGSTWVSTHQGVADSGGATQCQACHGTDYRGTILSKTLANRTLAGRSFPAGTIIGCYSCHNGPGGG